MTVAPIETDTLIDISALVGEMEAMSCEHSEHGLAGFPHTDAPASHYILFRCANCGYAPGVKAMCPGFVSYVAANGWIMCSGCEMPTSSSESMTILGPVNG